MSLLVDTRAAVLIPFHSGRVPDNRLRTLWDPMGLNPFSFRACSGQRTGRPVFRFRSVLIPFHSGRVPDDIKTQVRALRGLNPFSFRACSGQASKRKCPACMVLIPFHSGRVPDAAVDGNSARAVGLNPFSFRACSGPRRAPNWLKPAPS